jgi:hypothetical protein
VSPQGPPLDVGHEPLDALTDDPLLEDDPLGAVA